jgi:hypothetical protein
LNSSIKQVAWIVGLFLLLFVSYHFEHEATISAQETYRVVSSVWISTAISFVLGAYLSVLFIDDFKVQIDKSLFLFIFIPSTIVGFYIPIAFSFSLPFPLWVSKLNTHGFPTVLSGLSLMFALFNPQRRINY